MNYTKYYNQYCVDLEFHYNSKSTISCYKSAIKGFLNRFIHYDQPQRIPNTEIKEYLLRFNTINTRKHNLCAINSFYKLTVGMPSKIQKIPYPKSEKKLPIVLSVEEIQRMFDACENLKHKVILSLLYSCGLRVGELLNLKWSHIDRSRMIINVIQAKGAKDRQVMLSDSLLPILEKYFWKYKPDTYVLNGQSKLKYSQTSVNNVVKSLAKKAGINKKVYTHLIRHCSFTHMVENGIGINLIQKLAGHNSPKTTQIYTHISHNLISKIQSPINNIQL